MQNFAAIDFETANGQRSSICSVGLVIVRDGEVKERIYRLIRPRPNYYTEFCTRVHGLTYHDTIEAPSFPEVWEELAPYCTGLPFVAHNSPFDEGCLRAAFALYGLAYPDDYRFYCTCRAARRTFDRALPNHRLPPGAPACASAPHPPPHARAAAEACAPFPLPILKNTRPPARWRGAFISCRADYRRIRSTSGI